MGKFGGDLALRAIAAQMVERGKGILAADESSPTLTKRFESLGISSTEETRRDWREMLFASPGLNQWISGVILYDETIRQSTASGVPFPQYMADLGILPGIKVDTGAKPLAGWPGETITEGLDGLGARLAEYYKMGARFAKWRAVITIAEELPSLAAIKANAQALARYAGLCQSEGIVPIVEPEVLMDGDNTIERCFEVTSDTLSATFGALEDLGVELEGMVLKPSMVISGKKCSVQADVQTVAAMTIECYRRTVPAAVGGIALLSGGQSDELASAHLDAMAKLGPLPWTLTFSYGRALQDLAMKTWLGNLENYTATQKALLMRSEANSLAQRGLLV